MIERTLRGLALGLLVLAPLGCPSAPPPASQFPTAADALSRMKATFACQRAVKGEARIDHFSKRGRVRGKLLLFAARPNGIRFDLLSPPPFNSIVATLTTEGTAFALSDLRAHKFFEGPASACNVARLTEVPIEPSALVQLLGGQAPLLVHEDARLEIEWDAKGYYVVRIPSTRDASEEVHLVPSPVDFGKPWQSQRIRVLDVRVAQRGVELYHADLGAHEWAPMAGPQIDPDGLEPPIPPSGPPCTVEVPRKIHIEVPEDNQDVQFRYDSVVVNPPLPEGAFRQPIAPGLERVRVDCQ
jgi:hypothetical protein